MNKAVTIPRAEYDRLLRAAEDLADILAYDRAMAADEDSVPAEFVKRMVEGESPLRVYRSLRDMTQLELSRRSGVNRVQIAQIEAGHKAGSIETIRKLAAALSVTVDDLV